MFWKFYAELNIRNFEFHLKICIKLDIANIKFWEELGIKKIEFKNKDILLHSLKRELWAV